MPGIQPRGLPAVAHREFAPASAWSAGSTIHASRIDAPGIAYAVRSSPFESAVLEGRWSPVASTRERHQEPASQDIERLTVAGFAAGQARGALLAPPMSYAVLKRGFDLIATAVLAILVLPLFPLIALAIWLDSPGSVFYKQDRVGLNGRIFRIYKFRTMRADAERHGAVWASEGDPRVTRVGGLMRRSRIDELPQLLNVARGDMTFVGPRPERPEFTSLLERELPGYGQRVLVKPGLTGWAQVRYQYASSIEDTETKLEYDLYYVRRRSLRFDASILLRTIPVVFHLQGR